MTDADIINALEKAADIIHNEAIRLVQEGAIPPPLKPQTIKRKGSSKTLIDEGWLLGALQEKTRISSEGDKITAEFGIFDPNIAEYAIVHEYGSPPVGEDQLIGGATQRTPTRSFLRRAYDSKIDEAERVLDAEVSGYMKKIFRR